MSNVKYTKEMISEAVASSISLAEVLRKLGTKWSGGSQQNIKRRIAEWEIDTSHFLGQGANRGQHHKGGPSKKQWQEILVETPELPWRLSTGKLRRAMLEFGIDHCCKMCGNTGEWQGNKLPLEIDHIDRNWRNNRPDNLRFLCPNCHAQVT